MTPTEYPVFMTDGTNEYVVNDATQYINAVFSLGHRLAEPAEQSLKSDQ
ncbi:hypothetical protein ACFVJ5_21985 [Nocardia sp. NPDC127606]